MANQVPTPHLGSAVGIESRLMTVDDVCDYLGLSRDFVYDQVKAGLLRGSRMARQLRFRRADVDAFVDLHALDAPLRESVVPRTRRRDGRSRAG